MAEHDAAILPHKGGPLVVVKRTTPEPGPNDILIEVHAVALNPVDYYQRTVGLPPVPIYPAVIGGDVSGIVAKLGANVTGGPAPGTRVLASASAFWKAGNADYGGFQRFALARKEAVAPLPDGLSFEQGAICPLAAATALSAWTSAGIPLSTRHNPEDKQAVIIWGASSSVGSFAVQSAKTLGFTTYATCSPRHHELVKRLGADAVFDYKDSDVVAQIVSQAEKDGVVLHTAHCVVDGGLQPTLDILKQTKGEAPAKVAHSALLQEGHPTLEGTQITFTFPPLEEDARNKLYTEIFHDWLGPGLRNGTVVPSPNIQVEGGGLGGLNAALDKLGAGVSGTKIVVPL